MLNEIVFILENVFLILNNIIKIYYVINNLFFLNISSLKIYLLSNTKLTKENNPQQKKNFIININTKNNLKNKILRCDLN